MVVVRPGDWLWLSAPATSSFKVPIGCQVKQMVKNQVTVVDDEGRSHTFDVVKAASSLGYDSDNFHPHFDELF